MSTIPPSPAAHLPPSANDTIAGATEQDCELEVLARFTCKQFPLRALGWVVLGQLLHQRGETTESLACLAHAVTLEPNDASAHKTLGDVLRDAKQLEQSKSSIERALVLDPDMAKAHNSLAMTLSQQGCFADAAASLRRAVALLPDYVEAYNNLGVVLKEQELLEQAEQALRQGLQHAPDFHRSHYNLGCVLHQQGRFSLAEQSLRRALVLSPSDVGTHYNLGLVMQALGRPVDAGNCFRRVLDMVPDFPDVHTHLLFLMHTQAEYLPADCLAEARQFGRLQQRKVSAPYVDWLCDQHPARLRVGLVSGDFNTHAVGFFLEGWLGQIDPARIDLIAYAASPHSDGLTTRIKPHFSAWKSLVGLSDEAAAGLIHADGLHILVDLSGHTRHNRLPVFAWRAAPIQMSWLGYFATTGMAEIDYVLADPFVAPEAESAYFVEQLWPLPESYLCFSVPDFALEVAPLPALSTGHVTFGCFNSLTKMTDEVVGIWAAILNAVPGAILFLKTYLLDDAGIHVDTVQRFARHGIDTQRLRLEGSTTRAGLLAAYQQVDMALDPFPYPGGTTSLESLWMGVPVLTLQGNCFLSRIGTSIARNAGLEDWIAVDTGDYVARAVTFASRPAQLASLRANLREQVTASPLFAATRFARHLEAAWWGMWHSRELRP
jgi:protein O-GlcNAc transferase